MSRSRAVFTGFLVGCYLMVPSLKADDRIPSSLPKEKQQNLVGFLDRVSKEERGGLVPANARITAWSPDVALELPAADHARVEEYLAAVIPHRAKDWSTGPDKADVLWYRPNPNKKTPGVTVKWVVDLKNGVQAGDTEVLVGYPAPITNEEREQAIALAKERVPAMRERLRNPDGAILEVLFETLSEHNRYGDPGDRVVSLRLPKKGEKKLIAVTVNLTKNVVNEP